MKSLGRIFLTGMLTVLPVLATVYLVVWLVTAAERFVGKQLMWLIPDEYYRTGMGLVLAIALIFAIGLLMHALLFRRLFGWAERLLLEIPLVRSVYGALKDLFGLFAGHDEDEALQVVSVALPGTGARALGFVSRKVNADMKRFKDFIEARGQETGAWRGEIKHGANDDDQSQLRKTG